MTSAFFRRLWAMLALCVGLHAHAASGASITPAGASGDWTRYVTTGPEPAWVEIFPLDRIAPPEPVGGASVVLSDGQTSWLADDRWHFARWVADLTAREGLDFAGQFSIAFKPAYQRIRLHSLNVTRDGVTIERVNDVRIEVTRREERIAKGIVDGELTLEVFVPDLRVGDRVDYRYSFVGSNPVFAGHRFGEEWTSTTRSIGADREIVLAPESMPLNWRVSGSGVREDVSVRDGIRRLLFDKTPNEAVATEPGIPGWFDYGRIEFSSFESWGEVADWATALFEVDAAGRDAGAALSRELGLASMPDDEAMASALAFVQREVRYVALALDESSHRPASPATTLARRYGDCKDKSLLLVAMLQAAGVEAQPVLVHSKTRARTAERLPSAGAFDHVIVRARIDGAWRYADPTRRLEHGRWEDREPIPFGVGLPAAAGVDSLEPIPRTVASQPSVVIDQEIRLFGTGADRHAAIRLATTYRHGRAESIRSYFRNAGIDEIGRDYLAYMRRYRGGIQQEALPEIKDTTEDNVVRVVERYSMPLSDLANDANEVALELALMQIRDWVPAAAAETRVFPLEVRGPDRIVQEIRVVSRPGWAVEPEDIRIDTRWFEFQRGMRVDGDTLTVRAEWRRLVDAIGPDEYGKARRELRRVRSMLGPRVTVGARHDLPVVSREDALWSFAALGLLAVLLSLAYALRERNDVLGMFWTPAAATARSMERRGVAVAIGVMIVAIVMHTAIGVVARRWQLDPPPEPWSAHGRSIATALAGALLLVGGLRLSFRALGARTTYRRMMVATAWALWPFVFLLPLAILGAGPSMVLLSGGHGLVGPQETQAVLMLTCLVLLLVAWSWSAIAWISASATAAGTRRRVAVPALLLATGLTVGLAWLVSLAAPAAVDFSF